MLFETILPTGRAIRYKPLRTRAKLEIDRAVGPGGADVDVMRRTIMECVVAYTKPIDLKMRVETDAELLERGLQVEAAAARLGVAQPKLTPIEVVDIDATLDAVALGAWTTPTQMSWATDGPESFYEVFDDVADFQTAMAAIQKASGLGIKNTGLLAGKARALSSAP